MSALLTVWSGVVFVGGLFAALTAPQLSHEGEFCESSTVISSALVSLTVYSFAMFVIHHVMPSVSHPGGPRPHKIQRQPQWPEGPIVLPKNLVDGYRCLVADESHAATSDKFFVEISNGCGNLTGEPAGRQTWFRNKHRESGYQDGPSSPRRNGGGGGGGGSGPIHFLSSSLSNILGRGGGDDDDHDGGQTNKKTQVVDEAFVQSLARGGRDGDYDNSDGNSKKTGDGYVFVPSKNPNSNDQIFREQQIRKYLSKPGMVAPDTSSKPQTVEEACKKAAHFYSMLQCDDGHWAADYGGPHFLMPGLVTAWYVMGKPPQLLDDDQIALLVHYIIVHQQVDGGWGTHIESPSTMFGSTLMYVALRLMGTPADHPACLKGREFLKQHGGALYTSSWSKFYLCLLGLMDWKGHNSVRKSDFSTLILTPALVC